MSRSDQWISVGAALVIVAYLTVLTISLVYNKTSLFSLVNIVSALSIVSYWVQKQLRISMHVIDPMEIAILCFEVAVIGLGIYFIQSRQSLAWLPIVNKIVFGIHLLCLILFLIFMLTFKMNRLI